MARSKSKTTWTGLDRRHRGHAGGLRPDGRRAASLTSNTTRSTARAEADRRLGEVLIREEVPYHHVELPVRVTPSHAGRYLLEHLETIESGTVSITGFATAVAEEDRRDFLAILSVRREVLAELGLCQIWWLTPDFRDALRHIAPDLDSWFMSRLHLEEEFLPPGGVRLLPEPAHLPWSKYPIDEALRQATGLVERFRRAKAIPAPTAELVGLAVSAADAIVAVGAPDLTRALADELVSGLVDCCRRASGRLPFDGPQPHTGWRVSSSRTGGSAMPSR